MRIARWLGRVVVSGLLAATSFGVSAGEAEWHALMQQGVVADQRGEYRASIATFEAALKEAEAFGDRDPRLALTLNWLGESYRKQGRAQEAGAALRRSLGILERALGREHMDVSRTLTSLALVLQAQGHHREAEPMLRRSLDIAERALGPTHAEVGAVLANVANLHSDQGRYEDADPVYRRSIGILEKALGPGHPNVAQVQSNLAAMHGVQGRYGEAESLIRRSLETRERTLGLEHPEVGESLVNLASLYRVQGRHDEAEPVYRRGLAIRERALGPEHPSVAEALNNFGGLYYAQKRYAEAEPLFRRSLAIREKAQGPAHPIVAESLNNLAALYYVQERYADAEPLLRRALEIRERASGPEHPDVATPMMNLAGAYRAQDRYGEAEPLYRRSVAIREKVLGAGHPETGIALGHMAQFEMRRGRGPEGLALARRATQALAARFSLGEETARAGVLAEQLTLSWSFELHETILHAVEPGSMAEGFALLQLARASDTADQIARMAARHAAGTDALARIARERQDLIARSRRLDARLVEATSAPAQQRRAEAEEQVRAELEAARKSLAALDARMAVEFPQYAELANPKPVPLAEIQKLLQPEEALVAFLFPGVAELDSFAWIVRRDSVGWEKVALTRKQLATLVRKLRTQLDLGADDPSRILSRPFDVVSAHQLYARLFGPMEKRLAGVKHLIVVPDGALTSLPPEVLVTEAPAKSTAELPELASVPWLVKRYAITVLPAVSSLRALRQFAKRPASREPFQGFGDPVLQGSGPGERRKAIGALYSRGAVADVNEVKKLERLPETATELRAIASMLKAPASSVRLGPQATERAVKEANLASYRTLAFATHGLMAGDFKGLAEPALVLTPPVQGTELDDGLLTVSEISQLKLDADWVILSACNTAAPDGTPGADGLSGLAKAFFYAGARSLLVSHWAVDSAATEQITTRLFAEAGLGVSKAEALRRAELALMNNRARPHYAHPAIWAPFVLVGEGGGIHGSATTHNAPSLL